MRSRSSSWRTRSRPAPRFAPIETLTACRDARDSSSSSSSSPGGSERSSGACWAPGGLRLVDASGAGAHRLLDLADRQVLDDRPRASASWNARSGVPSSARAWPAESWPSATSLWILGGSWNSRSVLDTADAALADPTGQILVGEAEVLDELLVGRRLLERVQVLAVQVLDQGLLERGGVLDRPHDRGTVCRPARLAARQRRSPAISS